MQKKEKNEMIIEYYKKNVYGNTLEYAITFKHELQELTKSKTLSETSKKALEKMGFTFKQVLPID